MHPQAEAALKAAKGNFGPWATKRFLAKRGVPTHLYTLARVLEAARRAGL